MIELSYLRSHERLRIRCRCWYLRTLVKIYKDMIRYINVNVCIQRSINIIILTGICVMLYRCIYCILYMYRSMNSV